MQSHSSSSHGSRECIMKLFCFPLLTEHMAFGFKRAKALEDLYASPHIQET